MNVRLLLKFSFVQFVLLIINDPLFLDLSNLYNIYNFLTSRCNIDANSRKPFRKKNFWDNKITIEIVHYQKSFAITEFSSTNVNDTW